MSMTLSPSSHNKTSPPLRGNGHVTAEPKPPVPSPPVDLAIGLGAGTAELACLIAEDAV